MKISTTRFLKANNEEQGVVVKKICNNPDTKTLLINYINSIKAGSPTDERVFWVCQKPKEIAQKFAQSNQLKVSHGTVKRLLLELGYRYRKQAKELPTGTYANRNLQFHIITILILSMSMQSPVISIDCKKKNAWAIATRTADATPRPLSTSMTTTIPIWRRAT